MGKIITIGNHKGGVGKTTSTINIGAGLNNLGKKVLLVDLDPQANLSISLGVYEPVKSMYDYFKGEKVEPLNLGEGFDILPSNLNLSAAEIEMSSETGREFLLQDILSDLKFNYDYVLIDSPPSLGLLTLNALTASNFVLIPLQAHYLAMQGLSKFVEVVDKIRKRLNKDLEIGGVFVTQYDSRKVLNRNVLESIMSFFDNKVFNTKIRENIALAEAPTSQMDIFRYHCKSNGAEDYRSLCEEIVCL